MFFKKRHQRREALRKYWFNQIGWDEKSLNADYMKYCRAYDGDNRILHKDWEQKISEYFNKLSEEERDEFRAFLKVCKYQAFADKECFMGILAALVIGFSAGIANTFLYSTGLCLIFIVLLLVVTIVALFKGHRGIYYRGCFYEDVLEIFDKMQNR